MMDILERLFSVPVMVVTEKAMIYTGGLEQNTMLLGEMLNSYSILNSIRVEFAVHQVGPVSVLIKEKNQTLDFSLVKIQFLG